jgi:hypothetical protein
VSTSSTARGDTLQQRLLERLRAASPEPVSFAELRSGGVDFPAAIVSELELTGHPVDRVYRNGVLVGVRLLEIETSDVEAPPHQSSRWWSWQLRGSLTRRR